MKIVNAHIIKLALLLTLPLILFDGVSAQQAAANIVLPSTEITIDDPYISEFFQVGSSPKISVNTINGNIDVYQNSAINGVQVDLYVERSFSLWSGTRNLDNFRIVVQKRGNQIIASVEDRSRGGSSRRGGDVQFHFVVQVPADASTDLRTINGNIDLDGANGIHYLQNQHGELSVKNSSGEIRVISATGSMDLESLRGTVFAKTVTGDINIADNEGEVRVRSTSGSIFVERMNGDLAAATTSGDIITDFTDVTSGIYLETVSGNVHLAIPSDNGYDIKGRALRFDLTGVQQTSISRQSQRMNERNIVLRDGDIPVQMATVSGTIRVSEKH
ncbi:MAG: DUF4097 family beta strand repeat protein [Balneolaceae bacterium]|nr:DUF4097 family beta strand repeat protein [Balneolaceae bacterium]